MLMAYVYFGCLALMKSIARALDLALLYFNDAKGRSIAWFSSNGREIVRSMILFKNCIV